MINYQSGIKKVVFLRAVRCKVSAIKDKLE